MKYDFKANKDLPLTEELYDNFMKPALIWLNWGGLKDAPSFEEFINNSEYYDLMSDFAGYIIKDRWIAAEKYIFTDAWRTAYYAYMIQQEIPEMAEFMKTDEAAYYCYTVRVLKVPDPELEKILTAPFRKKSYAEFVRKYNEQNKNIHS